MRGVVGVCFERTFGVAAARGWRDGGLDCAVGLRERRRFVGEHFGPRMRYIGRGPKGMQVQRLTAIGARCPTGAGLSQGGWALVGGACAAERAQGLQFVLPVHGERDGCRRFEPRSFPAHLQDTAELQGVVGSFPDVADQRDAEFAGGPLPADEAGPADGFDRR